MDALVVWHPFTVEVLRRSRGLVAQGGVPGRDAVHAATALEGGFGAIVSCDALFDDLAGLRRIDPMSGPHAWMAP